MSKDKPKNLHTGHRERMKERFRKEGIDSFADHEVLELLLYFGIPQRDTNPLAHQLLEQFGSFRQIFTADYEQLCNIPGMTASAAFLLTMVPQLSRRYIQSGADQSNLLNTSAKIGEFLIPKFLGRTEEVVYLLCFNNACRLLRYDLLSVGDLNSSDVDLRRIVEIAFQCRALNIVLAHNHPHGLPRPSAQDVQLTRSLIPVLRQLGLELLDHFIVSGTEYASMAELEYLGNTRI